MSQMNEILAKVPAALASQPSQKVSNDYVFVPTTEIVDTLAAEGWTLRSGQQRKSKSNSEGAKHMLRFSNGIFADMTQSRRAPEIVIVNAHDTTAALRGYAGVIEFACMNGLIISSQMFNEFRINHVNTTKDDILAVVAEMTKGIPELFKNINRYEGIKISDKAKVEFAERAIALRYNKEFLDENGVTNFRDLRNAVNVESVMRINRDADMASNLWKHYNVVQENLIRGGFTKANRSEEQKSSEVRKSRPIKNIDQDIRINQGLWQLLEEFAN